MIKILIGGSPCTFWSIAQKNNRETEAEGLGWELFKNYLIAKEKFKPDLFLYENNKSAAQAIKEQISKELGVELMYINSALVSAQNRQRFYAFNWEVEQPADRGILLKDILENGENLSGRDKSFALTTRCCGAIPEDTLSRNRHTMVAEAFPFGETNGKSYTLTASYWKGQPAERILARSQRTHVAIQTDHSIQNKPIYEVKDGQIEIKGKKYPIKLLDGYYIIRKLTPVECERLQTLPDGYTEGVSDTQRYKGLGNGWTAEVIIHILQGALKDVPKDEEIVVLSMYDGIGTGRYCLDKMGFTNVKYFAYEIDKYAKQIAMKNYPDIIQMGDAFDLRHPDWTIGY